MKRRVHVACDTNVITVQLWLTGRDGKVEKKVYLVTAFRCWLSMDRAKTEWETGRQSIIRRHYITIDLHATELLFPGIEFLNEKTRLFTDRKMADTNRISAGSVTILQRS